MQAALKPRLWTRDEYDRMVEAGILGPEDKVELIEGEILAMSPQKSLHSTGVSLVLEELQQVCRAGFVLRAQAPLAVSDDSEPEPDVAVVRGSIRDFRDAHPESAVLVVEVSETTLAFDRGIKKGLYARVGVPEYWILNVHGGELEVFREPEDGEYRVYQRLAGGATVAPLAAPHARLAVSDLLP